MGTAISLRQLLMGVCMNTHWKYALFWKLNTMELTLEDFYIGNEVSGDYFNQKPGTISFDHDIEVKSGLAVNYPKNSALNDILLCSYKLGERIVGQVVSERKYQWISCFGSSSLLTDELYADWKDQSIAGIKTIVLVPVLPLGVVQLGSFEMILEDTNEVIRIRDCFLAIPNFIGTSISSSPGLDAINSNTPFAMPSHLMVQSNHPYMIDMNLHANDMNDGNSTFSNIFPDYICDPNLDLSAFADSMIEVDKFRYSLLGEELNTYSYIDPNLLSPLGHIGENFYIEENPILDGLYLSDPFVSELDEVPSPNSMIENGHFISEVDEWNRSTDIFHTESKEKSEAEHLLDKMITQLLDTSETNTSNELTSIKSCSNSSNKCSDSCLTRCKIEDGTLEMRDSMPRSHKRSLTFSDKEDDILSNSSTADNKLIIEQHNDLHKDTKSINIKRKHGSSSSHKPKPRDRQLIQDRIKELRDLIPDGSKCSIDALLDRTIKHMIFLDSIPRNEEKMGHFAGAKVDGKHSNTSDLQTNLKEASMDCNLVHKSERCPLIVKNLDQPGQMLIEMQCENYGLFLEMAQIIRRLKLTIINGIMETKSDELWAHFVIEVPIGFHRMDILWPLVQLLQRNNSGVMNKIFY